MKRSIFENLSIIFAIAFVVCLFLKDNDTIVVLKPSFFLLAVLFTIKRQLRKGAR